MRPAERFVQLVQSINPTRAEHQPRAGARELHRQLAPNAGAGAGDDDDHVAKNSSHLADIVAHRAMFTGIIERTVRVAGVADGPRFRRLTLAIDWPDAKLGESVAVNGVCLTIAEMSPGLVGFDVIKETLDRTNLGLLTNGDDVHVEQSLRV